MIAVMTMILIIAKMTKKNHILIVSVECLEY